MDVEDVESRVRQICMAFPEVYETGAYGHPNWRVGKKTFACFERYRGEWVVSFKASLIDQDDLVTGSDEYFTAPYVGHHGWVCRKIGHLDWDELECQLEQSYRLNATKANAAALGQRDR